MHYFSKSDEVIQVTFARIIKELNNKITYSTTGY